MKQKKYFILAAAAILMAACSENDIAEKPAVQQVSEFTTGNQAVVFDAPYVGRSTTRAGVTGAVTTADLKSNSTNLGKSGFGVFAFYTDNTEYDQLAIPNFMYNQKVAYDGSAYTYTPVKYWPNEFGSSAISDDADKVTFFAYAPYVPVTPSTGKVTTDAPNYTYGTGITALSRNTATGDPLVKYIATFEKGKYVDLCWGVCDNPEWRISQNGSTQQLTTGLPWLDVQRPKDVTQKMMFTFKHALTQLNVQVDADPDITTHDVSSPIATGTKIYVRSISFSGIAQKASLNLNNTAANTALWLDYNGGNDLESGEEVTIFDGRKDGKEGVAGATAANEKILGLNSTIIQNETASEGVLKTFKNVFESDEVTDPVYVIPTGEPVKVTIEYGVETTDASLSSYLHDGTTHGSSITNKITKEIYFGGVSKFESGKKYTIYLHLGLNSVKFDATVSPWDDYGNSTNTDLPANKPVFAASASPSATSVVLPATQSSYQFTVSGLIPGETVTVTKKSPIGDVTAASAVNADGLIEISASSITVNGGAVNKPAVTDAITVTGNSSGKKVTITLTQMAHELGLTASATNGSADITLSTTASFNWNDAAVLPKDASHIRVWRGGQELKLKTGTLADNTEFKFDAATPKITLYSPAYNSEKIYIFLQAGDAEGETVKVTF